MDPNGISMGGGEQHTTTDGSTTMSSSSSFLLERLSFDGTIRRVFSIFCQGFSQFVTLGFVLFIVPLIVTSFIIQPLLLNSYQIDMEQYKTDPKYIADHTMDILVISIIKGLTLAPFGWFVSLGSIHMVATMYMGRIPNMKQSLYAGCRVGPQFIIASIIAALAEYTGYLFFVIPGIYIGVRLFVFAPSLVIERSSIMGSLDRSWTLVRDNWCNVFCINLIVLLATFPGQMVWNAIVAVLIGDANTSSIGNFFSFLFMIILVPLIAIGQTVVYLNLRVEKEGLNADVLWNEFGRGSDSTGSGNDGGGHGYATLLTDDDHKDEAQP